MQQVLKVKCSSATALPALQVCSARDMPKGGFRSLMLHTAALFMDGWGNGPTVGLADRNIQRWWDQIQSW